MVPVSVGIDDIPGKDLVFILSNGINDRPFPGFRAGDNIGVDGKVPDIQAKNQYAVIHDIPACK
jgi:hypothetical protein